jgi:hypothetical protein
MPTNVQDFHDDTAFERYVLARGTPLVKTPEGGIVFGLGDDGSNSATVQAVVAGAVTSAGAPSDHSNSVTSHRLSSAQRGKYWTCWSNCD